MRVVLAGLGHTSQMLFRLGPSCMYIECWGGDEDVLLENRKVGSAKANSPLPSPLCSIASVVLFGR